MTHSRQTSAVSTSLIHSTGSFELVASGIILGLIGFGLDRVFGTAPILLLVCTALGFVGASISLYYRYRHQIETHEGPS